MMTPIRLMLFISIYSCRWSKCYTLQKYPHLLPNYGTSKNILGWWVTQLRNRELHITNIQSLTQKSQNDTLECTLEEMAVFKFLQSNPEAKQKDIAKPGQILKFRQEDDTNID